MKNIKDIEKKIGAVETILNGIKADVESLRKTEPEFKVGMWIIGINGCYPRLPERIKELEGDNWYTPCEFNGRSKDEEHISNTTKYIRPATKDEIETHLIAEAKRRGYKVGITVDRGNLISVLDAIDKIEKDDTMEAWEYDVKRDWLEHYGIVLYSAGKWAIILPSKKQLPKTKSEFNQLIDDWNEFPELSIDKFLDQYQF
jgi:hypothetical protein